MLNSELLVQEKNLRSLRRCLTFFQSNLEKEMKGLNLELGNNEKAI